MSIDPTAITHQEIFGSGDAYDERDSMAQPYMEKLEDGTATEEDILNFVLLIDSCGIDCIPQSMGMVWLKKNAERFAEIVGDVDAFMNSALNIYIRAMDEEQVSDPHLLGRFFFGGFLDSLDLMLLLSSTWRERMVSQVHVLCGSCNNLWIRIAGMAGVPREVVARAIINRLKHVKIHPGMANDLHDFLRYGGDDAGSMDPKTPWGLLNNEELVVALNVCAQKAPGRFLAQANRMEQRLGQETTTDMIRSAIPLLTSLQHVPNNLLNTMPVADRRILADNLQPLRKIDPPGQTRRTAQFLLRLMCQLPRSDRRVFFRENVLPVIHEAEISIVYRAWRQLKLDDKKLDRTLGEELYLRNWRLGIIKREMHRGRQQWCVQDGDVKVVMNRYQNNYFPRENEEVMWSTKSAKRLTSTVMAARFSPVMYEPR